MPRSPLATATATAVATAPSGIGFSGLLATVFITLKLLGKITWSWWWVTCPLWAVPALFIGGIILVIALLFLIAYTNDFRRWLKKVFTKKANEKKNG